MASRKARRASEEHKTKMKKGAKQQLIVMILSIALMIFSVTQVYYLAKYTLGYDVPSEKLKVYRWVWLLLEGPTTTEE